MEFCAGGGVVWSSWLEGWAACELLFEVFGAEDGDFDEQELAQDDLCVCVVQDSPDGDLGCVKIAMEREERRTYEILELSPGLLDDGVLPAEHDAHATEVAYLGAADDEGVDVEPSACEDARYAREDARFVLDEAIEDVSK